MNNTYGLKAQINSAQCVALGKMKRSHIYALKVQVKFNLGLQPAGFVTSHFNPRRRFACRWAELTRAFSPKTHVHLPNKEKNERTMNYIRVNPRNPLNPCCYICENLLNLCHLCAFFTFNFQLSIKKNHVKIPIRKRIQNISTKSIPSKVNDNHAFCGVGNLSFGGEYGR